AHPRVTLSVGFTEQRRDLLRDGLDLAVRIGRLEDSALKVRRLTVMPCVLVASPEYASGRAMPRTPSDLRSSDFVRLSAVRPELTLVRPGNKTPRTLRFVSRVAVDSATALREMAVAGLGVAALPELLARDALRRGRLVEVLPVWRMPALGVYAVWPGGTPRPALTLRFVDYIQARLTDLFSSSGD